MNHLNLLDRRRLPVVLGAEAAECGLASLTMIARYFGHDIDLNGMRQRYSVSMSGASLRSIMELADTLELSTRALRVDLEALPQIQTPAILHWDLNHFVVLKHVGRKTVTIHDPALGARRLSMNAVSKHFTGIALEVSPAKSFSKVTAKQPTRLKHLWSRMLGFWPAMIQVLGLSIALQIAVFAAPFYLQLTIDEALHTGDRDLMTVLALGFGALVIIQVTITALRSWALQSIGFLIGFQMTGNVVRHLIRLPVSYFEKRHVGDILSRIGSIRPIRDAITSGVISTAIDGMMAIVAVVILFLYSPRLAFIVLAGLILSALLTLSLYPFQRRRTEQQIIASAKEQSHMVESVRAAMTVKLMGREAQRENAWRNLFADVTNAGFSVSKYQIGMTAAQGLLTGLLTILVVYVAARMILAGDGFSVGMLFAFMSYRQTLSDRVIALINQIIAFRYITLHLDRVGDIVHAKSEQAEVASAMQLCPAGEISMKSVSFRYGDADRWVLKNATIDIAPREFVALTGKSGGGKTTLMKLLLGLYRPDVGRIELDGVHPSAALWKSWRQHIGVVAQDDQLLSGTIADNIAFFDPVLDMAKVRAAAVAAQIHEDITRMPMQYLSIVGDMGSLLSGGQRQRVLLARALYRHPKLLFLDEGTANLDAQAEAQIAELISSLPITRIVIAHRPALIERADKVYLVEEGLLTRIVPAQKTSGDYVNA
ncbi:MAG: peptidase domain-containing ABC transporter [Pseudomonadota bacterium]